jgi:aspartate kinase
MKDNVVVVKFGGSCLSTPENVLSAAKKIANEVRTGRKIIVVVSAMSGVTNQLLDIAKASTGGNVSKEDLDDILSMGERTSVRILTSALKSLKVKVLGIVPESPFWPIFTDSTFNNANIELQKTCRAVMQKLRPLLDQRYSLVVAGFVGLSPNGKITTLGRGGSDLTAVVLGNCIDAKEVIFVKDVSGILSADPKKVVAPQRIDRLIAEEAYSLASAGAKVIQPKALMFKKEATTLRVVGFNADDLSGGTVITGELNAELDAILHKTPISMITLITQNGSLSMIIKMLTQVPAQKIDILGMTVSSTSLLLYVQNPYDLVESLHEKIRKNGIAKAIHCIDSLAMITIIGYRLESIPGIIDAIISPLARENINLYGVFTISSSIKIFVQWDDREKAKLQIENVLTRFKDFKGRWYGNSNERKHTKLEENS